MLNGVPNLAWCVGYTNASWTLRADLASRHVCRLINFMERHGYDQVMPEADPGDVQERPLLDLSSGYIARAAGELPRQGTKAPWFLRQNYLLDLIMMRLARVDHPSLSFSRTRAPGVRAEPDEPAAQRIPRGVAR